MYFDSKKNFDANTIRFNKNVKKHFNRIVLIIDDDILKCFLISIKG